MLHTTMSVNGIQIPVITLDAAVIGTGCAGFNAADWLYDLGRRDIAILTEGVNMGTSRNTGSDKQTYYKLSLASDGGDSVDQMAQTLFDGEGVNGDTALTEAACSVRSFIKLANLGVPFPTNRYGEYVGYKTDHDPRQRATSAGPLTSKYMTEALERSVKRKGIQILDGVYAVRFLVRSGKLEGLLAVNANQLDMPNHGVCVFRTEHVIMATGGPAGVYYTSVYPESQTGMSGMALEAGAEGANLQEWQYGLASVKFRWNVSGTYQQVLPRYISIDQDGVEREFLLDYFDDPYTALNMEFLKGYQWPFDSAKVAGSSMIDIIVHHEVFDLGRRVYMDFRREPTGLENGFDGLGEEAHTYLKNSGALLPTPIKRLEKMNAPAIELYRNHGIDLYTEPLEISVCAQHNNGGIAVDDNWQTCVQGLYVAGEAAGTFGVHRPGGSALNSTQVGSMRAAEHIACTTEPDVSATEDFLALAEQNVSALLKSLEKPLASAGGPSNIHERRRAAQKRMSLAAAHIRDVSRMREIADEIRAELETFYDTAKIASAREIPALLKNRDILVTQLALLSAMETSAREAGSRGSCLVLDPDGERISDKLSGFSYCPSKGGFERKVLRTRLEKNGFVSAFEPVRPIPEAGGWFENIWNEYRASHARIKF